MLPINLLMTKKILFVCLGNICRSPAAEAVFCKRISSEDKPGKYFVDSAGTGGWHIGRLADSRMRKAALERGVVMESRARQIGLNDFMNFDLILTMDNSNFADVTALSKQAGSSSKADVKPILSFARNTSLTEVPDPYYGGEQGFDDVLDLLEDAIEGLLFDLNSME